MSLAELKALADCFHCGEPVPHGLLLTARVAGEARPMCCHGCAAVAEAIEAAGLSDFYRQRSALGARAAPPPLQVESSLGLYDDPRFTAGHLQSVGPHAVEVALLLEGVTCQACVWLNERRLAALSGVQEVVANYSTRRLRVRFDPGQVALSKLLQTVAELGYRAAPYEATRAAAEHRIERQRSLMRVGIAGLCSMQVMMVAFALYTQDDLGRDWTRFFNGVSLLLCAPVVGWCAWPFHAGAWRDLRGGRLGMDVPVSLGILAAFAGSLHGAWTGGEVWWDSATMFVFLLLSGRHVELVARHAAESTALELTRMTPALAHRLEPAAGSWREEDVPVAALAQGDRIRVRPGELIPADATVLSGRSSVEQALLTGESMPVARGPGDAVTGGTLNLESPLELRVDAVGEETLLAGLRRLLERAQSGKSRITELADRWAGWFIAAVLLLSALVAMLGLAAGDPTTLARTIAILVATCPCALSLATPATVIAVSSRWLRLGLLATRAHAVETFARATHIVFDKTGTLTEGSPRLLAVRPRTGLSGDEALAMAAALAAHSEHPLSRALVAAAPAGPRLLATDVQSTPGLGLVGIIGNTRLALGAPGFAAGQFGRPPVTTTDSHTVAVLADTSGELARFSFADTLRSGAAELVAELERRGVLVLMLTGDGPGPAAEIAGLTGIRDWQASLRPEDKLAHVRRLLDSGAVVAMVGDGLNDAPVLAAASVSIAMGQGTPLARSAADAVFMGQDLQPLSECHRVARHGLAVIRQNLAWAVVWNLAVLPAAAGGVLSAWVAALGMSLSSALVILNAARLVRAPGAPALPRYARGPG